tara:strand:+ start:126 stop:458 length:333 start_codon:yes stop_codon:yes gene_type:complete
MKKYLIIFFIFIFQFATAQYKDDISIVQFTADFAESVSLKDFKNHNTFIFKIESDKKYFDKENVKVVPTIILFHNGKEIKRIKANIMLELPQDWSEKIAAEIDQILNNKF